MLFLNAICDSNTMFNLMYYWKAIGFLLFQRNLFFSKNQNKKSVKEIRIEELGKDLVESEL